MMKSRITLEVDFDTRMPYIKVVNDTLSDDIKDQLVTDFRNQLSKQSQWCKVTFLANSREPVITMRIDPITPDQFKEQADIMLYEHGRNAHVNPVMKDIVNSIKS